MGKVMTVACTVAMLVTMPGISVLADEVQVEEIVITEAEEPMNSEEQLIGEGEILGSVTVGDHVTATFDEDTGEVVFYSNNGYIMSNWTENGGIDISKVRSIRVESGLVGLSQGFGEFKGCTNLVNLDLSHFRSSRKMHFVNTFAGCSSLTHLDLSYLETSWASHMISMFEGCSSLTELDLSSFNTSQLEALDYTFKGCTNLTELKFGNFDTSRVEYMSGLFYDCKSLDALDLECFDTSSVVNMAAMFKGCSHLMTLDLSNFDTSNVFTMESMFEGCSSLISLDLSSFDTSNIDESNLIVWSDVFTDCSNLQFLRTPKKNRLPIPLPSVMFDELGNEYTELPDLDESIILTKEKPNIGTDAILVGNRVTATFDAETGTVELTSYNGELWTNWVEKLGVSRGDIKTIRTIKGTTFLPADSRGYDVLSNKYMLFGGLTSLKNLELENFDTSNVTRMDNMFKDCGVESLDLSGFDTSKVTRMYRMFCDCVNLKNLDISNFDTSNVTDMQYMFQSCSSLTSLDLCSINTSSVTKMNNMFEDCSKLTSLNLSSFDTSNVTTMSCMFQRCRSLVSIDLSGFKTTNLTNMMGMFDSCEKLESLDLSNFDTSRLKTMFAMFKNCSKLTSLNLSNFDTSNVTDMRYLFKDCSNLESLNLSGFDTSRVTDMAYMFQGCSRLKSLDLKSFDTLSVTDMFLMFGDCNELTSLDLRSFDISNVTDTRRMFNDCTNLENLDLSSFDMSKGVKTDNMLYGCIGLQSLKTPKNHTGKTVLPVIMYDKSGKSYTELLAFSDSIILTARNPVATPTPTPKPTTKPSVQGFSDVQNPSHAYYKAIYWAANAGIAKGYSDGTFGINRFCTRGEMMMFLWRYAGKPAPEAVSKSPFSDVPKTHAFYKAILWGSQKGITKGYPNGTFGIDRNVSRGECMMFLWRLKGKPTPNAVARAPFPDVPKSHAFYNAVLWGYQKKITTGFTSGKLKGKFGVNENCSRGQIVTFLYRAK